MVRKVGKKAKPIKITIPPPNPDLDYNGNFIKYTLINNDTQIMLETFISNEALSHIVFGPGQLEKLIKGLVVARTKMKLPN